MSNFSFGYMTRNTSWTFISKNENGQYNHNISNTALAGRTFGLKGTIVKMKCYLSIMI